MKERELAADFTEMFKDYSLHVPVNTSMSGWPDRFIQLPNSRLVACELKIAGLSWGRYFRLNMLRQPQAVWLAKWQRSGGLCFLLLAMHNQGFMGYVTITVPMWKDWLTINDKKFPILYNTVFTRSEDLLDWFRVYASSQQSDDNNGNDLLTESVATATDDVARAG